MKPTGPGAALIVLVIACGLWMRPDAAGADDKAAMQERLNAEVLDQGFDVKGEAELNAYIEEATKKGLKPKEYAGSNWRPGYTCHDLRRYSWREYRDCMFYYRYHGRYYPY